MNGMIGWASRSTASSTRTSVRRVPRCCASLPFGELVLGDLDVPVAVLVPDEAVDRARDVVEAVLGEAGLDLASARCRVLTIQRSQVDSSTGALSSSPQSLPSVFISTKRVAFHSLLQKLR